MEVSSSLAGHKFDCLQVVRTASGVSRSRQYLMLAGSAAPQGWNPGAAGLQLESFGCRNRWLGKGIQGHPLEILCGRNRWQGGSRPGRGGGVVQEIQVAEGVTARAPRRETHRCHIAPFLKGMPLIKGFLTHLPFFSPCFAPFLNTKPLFFVNFHKITRNYLLT